MRAIVIYLSILSLTVSPIIALRNNLFTLKSLGHYFLTCIMQDKNWYNQMWSTRRYILFGEGLVPQLQEVRRACGHQTVSCCQFPQGGPSCTELPPWSSSSSDWGRVEHSPWYPKLHLNVYIRAHTHDTSKMIPEALWNIWEIIRVLTSEIHRAYGCHYASWISETRLYCAAFPKLDS